MYLRYCKALGVSLLVTYGLFFLMSSLIASGKNPFTDDKAGNIVDFVRVKQDLNVNTNDREVKKPAKPEVPPPPQQRTKLDPVKAKTDVNAAVAFDPNLQLNLDALAGDGDYLPIVRVAPMYPRRAAERGLEGYVDLEFVVTKLGTVANPVVIDAQPPGVFNSAARRAVLKFKYKPKVENGKPVDTPGVQTRITFQLEAEKR